MSIVQAHTVRL